MAPARGALMDEEGMKGTFGSGWFVPRLLFPRFDPCCPPRGPVPIPALATAATDCARPPEMSAAFFCWMSYRLPYCCEMPGTRPAANDMRRNRSLLAFTALLYRSTPP